MLLPVRLVHKRRPQSGGRGCPCSTDIYRTKGMGFSVTDVRIFWCKNFEFFEIYCVFARKEGWVSTGIFRTRGKGSIFCDFCADVFYGCPLFNHSMVEESS